MYMTARMSAAMKGTRMRELRALGYTSDVFVAKWKGGTCGLSGLAIPRGAYVAYFRDFGLCLSPKIDELLAQEKRDRLPKCGCGRPAVIEQAKCCDRCFGVAYEWFDDFYENVTRDVQPKAVARE